MKHVLVATFFAGLAACSLTFDGNPGELPFVNSEPDTASLPKLNHQPTPNVVRLMFSADGAPWATFTEYAPTDGGAQKGVRLVRLSGEPAEQLVAEKEFFTTGDSFYIFDRDPMDMANGMTRLSILDVGAQTPSGNFTFPGGPDFIMIDNFDERFLYFVEKPETTTYQVLHRDGSFTRTLPVPDGVDPTNPNNALFSFNLYGSILFVLDGNSHLRAFETDREKDYDLGVRPSHLYFDDDSRLMTTCGADGLRQFSIDGGPDLVLDLNCDPTGTFFPRRNDDETLSIVYTVAGQTYIVPYGGGTPALVLIDGLRLLAFGPAPNDPVMYSDEPDDEFVNGASDGYIGSWKFMERGLAAGWSRDGTKLRWLEHAAQPSGVGQLMVAPSGGGPATELALNVRQYDELRGDGRVLAAANHAFKGTQNRVVAIDEKALTQAWVADQAHEYATIPGSTDLLIDVVTGPSTYDIVRVKLPPKQ